MNDLFKLTTITTEFDFNQLKDDLYYTCLKADGTAVFESGKRIKSYPAWNTFTHIYLPHTEEKKVSEEILFEAFKAGCLSYLSEDNDKELKSDFKEYYSQLSTSPLSSQVKEVESCDEKCQFYGLNQQGICCKTWKHIESPSVEVSKESLGDWNEIFENYKLETGASAFATHNFAKWLNKNYPVTLQEVTNEEIEKYCAEYCMLPDNNNLNNHDLYSFTKWMRDKLKGGNTK